MRAPGAQPAATTSLPSQRLAAGGGSLDGLRGLAHQDPKTAIKEVAKQFEALFMQELMKSMRATTHGDGMTDNNATEMATGLLDQQYSTQMTGQPGGLADAIARQLERQMGGASTATGHTLPGSAPAGLPVPPRSLSGARPPAAQVAAAYGVPARRDVAEADDVTPASTGTAAAQTFLQRHGAAAQAVAAESGIPAQFMLAQAAHETGWGRKELRGADGSTANNFFGIKAGANWTGPTVTATTTEVINGQPQKVQARFRAYATPEESFRDYAKLIGTSPRYAGVMQAGNDAHAFAQGLQRAGYATDPQYAAKLGRVIQTTERLQRQLG